jgi:integrase/recombinase XerD
MLGKQAKIVSSDTLRRMLDYTRQTRQPKRDAVIVLLSVKAGLRACEIAGLEWSMVMTDAGSIGDIIDIRNAIAKRGSGRRIPMHPSLQQALVELWPVRTSNTHIVASNRGGAMRPNSIVNWFVTMFAELELEGCSSHSGRRTFITTAAKNVHRAGGSLRDVQLLAGHRSIDTTQRYIEGDTQSQRRLVSLL